MSNNNPSVNPADLDHLGGAFDFIFFKLLQGVAGAMPVQVVGTDGTYVSVQHLVLQQGTSGNFYARGQIARIPILKIGGGGFLFNVPVTTGDQGFILACDRDISLFLQNGSESAPNTTRVKDFADGFFIPCVFRNYTIADEDSASAVIQTLDGSVKVAVSNDSVTVTGTDVDIITTEKTTITSPIVEINASNTLTLNVSGLSCSGGATKFTINSPVPVQINNNVYVQGDIIATGSIMQYGVIPP